MFQLPPTIAPAPQPVEAATTGATVHDDSVDEEVESSGDEASDDDV